MKRSKLPFVFVNVAMTADGKIAPANRRFVPFGSKRDQDLMMELRARADAVMSGATTVNLGRVDLGPGAPKYRRRRLEEGLAEYNLRVVVSGSGNLNPKAHIFSTRFSPIIILTTTRASKRRLSQWARVADGIHVSSSSELDFAEALAWLRKNWNVQRLLCEGGGAVNAPLFRNRLVDELFLTICPVIMGGRDAPTLADGEGGERLEDASRLQMKSIEKVGNELFLVFRLSKRSSGAPQ